MTLRSFTARAEGRDEARLVPEAGVGVVPGGDRGVHAGVDLRVADELFGDLDIERILDLVVAVEDRVVDALARQLFGGHEGVGEV